MKIIFTFPGQGGQRPQCWRQSPIARLSSPGARRAGDEVDTLDSADALKHTRAVQLCLLIAGVARARELQRRAWIRRWSAGSLSARFRQR